MHECRNNISMNITFVFGRHSQCVVLFHIEILIQQYCVIMIYPRVAHEPDLLVAGTIYGKIFKWKTFAFRVNNGYSLENFHSSVLVDFHCQ